MTEETTQQFLARRKKELLAQISALKGQLAPKEAELAQITKFETASQANATSSPPPGLTLGSLYGAESALQVPDIAAIFRQIGPDKTNALARHSEAMAKAGLSISQAFAESKVAQASAGASIAAALSRVVGVSPTSLRYAHMTIKQMVVQALLDHFPKGASAAEIREYIRDGYGREVDPSSLRPQMHRLKAAGVLLHYAADDVWNLPKKVRENPILQTAGLPPGEPDEE